MCRIERSQKITPGPPWILTPKVRDSHQKQAVLVSPAGRELVALGGQLPPRPSASATEKRHFSDKSATKKRHTSDTQFSGQTAVFHATTKKRQKSDKKATEQRQNSDKIATQATLWRHVYPRE